MGGACAEGRVPGAGKGGSQPEPPAGSTDTAGDYKQYDSDPASSCTRTATRITPAAGRTTERRTFIIVNTKDLIASDAGRLTQESATLYLDVPEMQPQGGRPKQMQLLTDCWKSDMKKQRFYPAIM